MKREDDEMMDGHPVPFTCSEREFARIVEQELDALPQETGQPRKRPGILERDQPNQPVVPWVPTGRTSAIRDSTRRPPDTPTESSVASRRYPPLFL